MKNLLLLLMVFSFTFSYASEKAKTENTDMKKRIEKHIQEQQKKEKKYSKEKAFYKEENYDFKGAQVDEGSVKNLPEAPNYNDDFDMDSVYD